jgi:hypothetical protein
VFGAILTQSQVFQFVYQLAEPVCFSAMALTGRKPTWNRFALGDNCVTIIFDLLRVCAITTKVLSDAAFSAHA